MRSPVSRCGLVLWLVSNAERSMPVWLILQLVTIASMPAAYDMARERGRSPKAWLWAAFFVGPLALLALLMLGRHAGEARGVQPWR